MEIIQEFINKGLIKKDELIDFSQIQSVLAKSNKSIESAKMIMDNDPENSYQLAYEAMLLAGRALVFSFGYRPRAAGSHKIVVDFSEKVLGEEFSKLVFKFNKMRKIRHYLIYGTGLSISETDSKNAISSAITFLKEIESLIEDRNPQLKLK
jgi:uncharacterized protein (UPF0332 family)